MSNHARKYIWMSAGGGLLQFALIALIAFSGAGDPARPHPSATPPASKQTLKVSPTRSAVGTDRAAGPPARTVRVERPVATKGPRGETNPDAIPARAQQPATPDGEQEAQEAATPDGEQEEKVREVPDAESTGTPAAPGLTGSLPPERPAAPATGEDSASTPDQNGSTPDPPPQQGGGPPARPAEGEAPADPPAPAAVPAAVPADLGVAGIERLIRDIFGEQSAKAIQVAHCESELDPDAQRGQFLGLFQMGPHERAEYGYSRDPLAQIEAAYRLFLARGWQPWVCG